MNSAVKIASEIETAKKAIGRVRVELEMVGVTYLLIP